MSVEAMSWALLQTTGSTSRKAVLLALADRAGFDWTCWPSQATISRETEMDVRSARRILAELEALGLIERKSRGRPGGGRSSDLITLTGQSVRIAPVDNSEQSGHLEQAMRTSGTGKADTGVRGTIIEPSLEPPCITTEHASTAEELSTGRVGEEELESILDEAADIVLATRETNGYGVGGPGARAKARKALESRLVSKWLAVGADRKHIVRSLASRVTEPELQSTPPRYVATLPSERPSP